MTKTNELKIEYQEHWNGFGLMVTFPNGRKSFAVLSDDYDKKTDTVAYKVRGVQSGRMAPMGRIARSDWEATGYGAAIVYATGAMRTNKKYQ